MFRGYDHTGERTFLTSFLGKKSEDDKHDDRGDTVIIYANKNDHKSEKDLDRVDDQEDTSDEISFASCNCPVKGQVCPSVPDHLCAVGFDKKDCGLGDWDTQLDIPVTEKLNLGL